MAIKIVSDIHGEFEALSRQLEPGDLAILLGDYLNLIDFRTLGGLLSEVYTREEIISALAALAEGNREIAGRAIREIASSDKGKPRKLRDLMRKSYKDLFSSIPCRAIVIFGNTDNPEMMTEIAGDNVEIVEAGSLTIESYRFGLISGSPYGPWTVGLPGEVPPERYEEMLSRLGPVDVLCSHCPPSIPDLTFDTMANRDEVGSPALLKYVELYEPAYHFFGHVHNPRRSVAMHGPTRLVNTGFFKEHRKVYVFKS